MKAYVLVGNSKRLPRKHFIEVAPGLRLIDMVIQRLHDIGLEVYVYSKIPVRLSVPVLIDKTEWLLPSIISLFSFDSEFFLFGGDMPMVRKEAVDIIASHTRDGLSVVPRWSNGYLEPLHAFYTPSALPCLHGELKEEKPSLTHALSTCPGVRFLAAESLPEETFFNVNTAEELERLRRMVSGL